MRVALLFLATAFIAMAVTNPSLARSRRHHHATPPVAEAPASEPFMFYPQHVEGGVDGNLSFNNQIRKHTDPLNANGGR